MGMREELLEKALQKFDDDPRGLKEIIEDSSVFMAVLDWQDQPKPEYIKNIFEAHGPLLYEMGYGVISRKNPLSETILDDYEKNNREDFVEYLKQNILKLTVEEKKQLIKLLVTSI